MSKIRVLLFTSFALLAALSLGLSAQSADKVDIQITYPNGKSPKVFTAGWTFGAKAVLISASKEQKDVSKQVKWSGSGSFSPAIGAVSHPAFSSAGANTIELSVKVGKETYSQKFSIQTVEPDNFATIGDKAYCPADAHGCPACPHVVVGPIVTGNSKVKINGKAVACVGDTGKHASCCGANTFKITSGNNSVLIDGKPVAQLNDKTQHCGGVGYIVESTFTIPDGFAGKFSGAASGNAKFTIKAGSVVGSFKGGHGMEGGGGVDTKLTGTFNPRSGSASGTITGSTTYVGFDNKTAKASVAGTFTGRLKGNTFKGTWKVVAKGLAERKASGSFNTTRAKK